ncbi:MAG: hypothetical protein KBS74_06255 [Clostridiales bacterium]|nr:hypothetical protein [Candidatus Cacconaster stercorequi]
MANKKQYKVNSPVYGNLAYDLDALVLERNLEEAGKMQEEQRRRETVARPRPVARPRQKVSPLALGSVVVLVAMAVALLLGYVRLNTISDSVCEMKAELSQLDDEHVALLTKYEQTYDLATVKETAEKTGMSKPSGSQIEYIDLGGPDAATVYHAAAESAVGGLMDSTKQVWQMAVEYFS